MLERLRRLVRRPSGSPEPRPVADSRADRDRDLVLSLSPARIPSWRQLRFLPQILTNPERRSFRLLGAAAILGTVILAIGIGREHIHAVPAQGGSISIGFVGSPQTINPVFARPGTVDYALTKLMYRGLTQIDAQLQVQPDIADTITSSADGKSYTITLRQGELWSDETPVTANDVKFTYDLIKDPAFRSPYQTLFAPISTDVVDDATLRITTTQPSLNLLTTLSIGILPQHLWLDASSTTIALAEYNIKPIGNGAWKFQNITKDRSGVIKSYSFIEQKSQRGKTAYAHTITTKFYPDHDSAVEAVRKQSIDILTNVTTNDRDIIGKKAIIHSQPINQVLGLWFNQNTAPALKHIEVRQALEMTLDRSLAEKKLGTDQSITIVDPVLVGYPGYRSNQDVPAVRAAQVPSLLEAAGWKKNSAGIWTLKKEVLKFTLAVPNDPVYVELANAYATSWKQIGIDVSVNSVDPTQIAKEVVRPRLYDLLLFGQQYGADGDLYTYWHSSQQKDPGFALAIWSSTKADQDLQKSRTALDANTRAEAMNDFQSIVRTSVPAVILAQSKILIAHQANVRGLDDIRVVTIGDLFALMPQLYVKTKLAWK